MIYFAILITVRSVQRADFNDREKDFAFKLIVK